MDNLQFEASEFELIRFLQKGVCLYKCGNERYLLEVKAPEHKAKLFGEAGGGKLLDVQNVLNHNFFYRSWRFSNFL